jgi:hypothetical protein
MASHIYTAVMVWLIVNELAVVMLTEVAVAKGRRRG